jgi:hypothetical protein
LHAERALELKARDSYKFARKKEARREILRGRLALALLAFRNFLAIDGNISRRFDADADLRSVHCHDGHLHIVPDAQAFAGAASEYQHEKCSGW